MFSFNSRARKGRDLDYPPRLGVVSVSIHAPARGATSLRVRQLVGGRFQFTRPQGARLSAARKNSSTACFNSRARKGRDGGARQNERQRQCFNSRARKGRDAPSLSKDFIEEFQFTRPQGARQGRRRRRRSRRGFQFTRPQGARLVLLEVRLVAVCFNSRARKGRDRARAE